MLVVLIFANFLCDVETIRSYDFSVSTAQDSFSTSHSTFQESFVITIISLFFIGMLQHSFGGALIIASLKHFIAPALVIVC